MWHELNDDDDLANFMSRMDFFHDSCIKELHYLSGAYVNKSLSMHPVNDCRKLRVVVQRQCEKNSMIELEFHGLNFLKLFPVDENYTCEILDSTMIMKDGNIYWCDCGGLSAEVLESYTGTLICASKLRWRSIEKHMGKEEFYRSDV